ncbi:hypothetical protein Cgig2_000586 [Carnegiea gigantea]|uniref:DUF4283 domain-containing protein n=1 Tax=Carnegiea gigantea TaxID=171969 RepID=A0A9Q1JMG0_9CARY|nr:hypothetical protein Cgig2_000586 [Carnegiea gigantea]
MCNSTAKSDPPTPSQIQSSFTQLVDPNEGTKLNLVRTELINGIKSAKLVKSDVENEVLYWQNSVLCTVLGANPPLEDMKGFLKRIWENFDIDKILYGIESLSKIGSVLGIPIKTDEFTKDKQVLRYTRLLIQMPIDGPFLDHIDFFNDEDVLIRQQVTSEWLPTKCTHCAMLGHSVDVCKKKEVIRTEWRKIQKPQTPTNPTPLIAPVNAPNDQNTEIPSSHAKTDRVAVPIHSQPGDFILVTKGASPSRLSETAAPSLALHHNSFNALNDVPNLVLLQREDPNSTLPHGTHC